MRTNNSVKMSATGRVPELSDIKIKRWFDSMRASPTKNNNLHSGSDNVYVEPTTEFATSCCTSKAANGLTLG